MDAAGPTEYTAETAEQFLLERLRDEFLLQAYEYGDDVDLAAEQLEAGGVVDAVRTICADSALRDLALSDHTGIRTEALGTDLPLFRFENGAWAEPFSDDFKSSVNFDFPMGTGLVVYGDLVASATPHAPARGRLDAAYGRQAGHRRAEQSYFRAEANKRRTAGELPFAEYLDLLAEACGDDATSLEPAARNLRQWRTELSMERVILRRRHAAGRVAGLQGRRLDRRLGCGRPRTRALARSSSRGGDSGDSSDDPEPARRGDRVGDTSRTVPLRHLEACA